MTENRTMPAVSVIPELIYADVPAATDWLCRVFGFSVRWRAGEHRAQLAYRDGALIVAEARTGAAGEPGAGLRSTPPGAKAPITHEVMVRVPDADAHHAHAREQGAEILAEPRDFPYGERQYSAVDLGAHHWTFSQSIADVAPEDWGGASGSALGPAPPPGWVAPVPDHLHTVTARLAVTGAIEALDFYARAFGAAELGERFTGPDGELIHAELQVGDSVVMVTEDDGYRALICTYWPDVDAAWERALAAGADVLFPLADHFYGERGGRLRDPYGQEWMLSARTEALSPDELRARAGEGSG